MSSNAQRTLADVELDLSDALRCKTGGMLEIGRLLNEAKDLVEHGQWLSWLRRYTALTSRSAQRYMKAASWADARKSDTVSLFDLQHLSPKAIYALASGKYDDEVVELVLSAAATAQRHLNETDVSDIAKRGAMAAILKEIEADQKAEAEAREADRVEQQAAQDARRAEWEAQQAEAERERAEAEAILDGGPDPGLPQAPEPIEASAEAFHVTTFENAIDRLRSVMTKPLSTFASVKISPSDIEQITAFLQEVAKQIAEKRRAA
jgi:Protein of unknown function (DUF3102)